MAIFRQTGNGIRLIADGQKPLLIADKFAQSNVT